MVTSKTKKKKVSRKSPPKEVDSVYFLKLVFYLILGSFWVRLIHDGSIFPFPLGLVAGLYIASRERFQIDRKIEYAILLIAMFVGFWLPLGLDILI